VFSVQTVRIAGFGLDGGVLGVLSNFTSCLLFVYYLHA